MQHRIVSHDEWLALRKQLLVKEKEFTRRRDQLAAERRALPWVKVEKPYVFDGPDGKETLADLFGGHSQLIIKHFMFGPGWSEGCVGCSFGQDHVDGILVHLKHRDVSYVPSRVRRCRKSKPSKSEWAGRSNGYRPLAAISISTSMSRSGRRKLPRARFITTTKQAR